MNTDPITVFARKLIQSPDILNGDLDSELVEQIHSYAKGELSGDDSTIIAELIQDDADAASCYQRCLENLKLATQEQHSRIKPSNHVAFFDRLSDKASGIIESFQSLFTQPQTAYGCSTDAIPIYGKAGPNEEVMFTMRPTSLGQTEISLSTKTEAWSSLIVSLGEYQREMPLEQIGNRWAGSLEFPLSFAGLSAKRLKISVKNS